MMRRLVVLSGAVASGKSTLAEGLCNRFDGTHLKTRELIDQLVDGDLGERGALQRAGEQLDHETGGAWVANGFAPTISGLAEDALIVVDSVRVQGQIDELRRAFGRQVIHVHLRAAGELAERYERRREAPKFTELPSYDEVRADPTERAIDELVYDADVVIDTARCTEQDVEVRASCYLGLRGRDVGRVVDVLVGGQYGSEGKGNIAAYIASDYDLLVRVGGPNAGHRVFTATGEKYTHRLLPSGSRVNEQAHLLIGPGAVLNLDLLLQEIADSGVEADRLTIDRRALLISWEDIEEEMGGLVQAIGSTGQGGGAAAARRILGRRGRANVTLVEDVPELSPYCGDALEVLEEAYLTGQRVLLEGTQGTDLSLYHGRYPHVTSRDTTVSGCLAEAGVAPARVRRVVLVIRSYPIRVEDPEDGTSGPMSREINWDEVAARSGHVADELKNTERGSVSGNLRRVGEFDWEQLRRSVQLNGPTDIALTFSDYFTIENQKARRLDQLNQETIRFISEVERVAGVPVSLISTRFHTRSIIDRRSW